MNTIKKDMMYSLGIVVILLLSVGGYLYRGSAMYVMDQYIQSINDANYASTYEILYKTKELEKFEQKYIVNYVKEYFEKNNLIKMSRKEIKQKEDHFVTYQIVYEFEDSIVNSTIGIAKQDNRWKVVFPFKIQPVKIYVPTGGQVILEDKKIVPQKQEGYIEISLLPGKYNVIIQYPEGTKADYRTTINVPTQKEVQSLYKLNTVEIKAPVNTVVELAGHKKQAKDGQVTFQNVVDGNYTVRVFDEYNTMEEYSQIIEVREGENYFDINQVNVSQEGYKKISQFINQFYKDYKQGIIQREIRFFEEYGEIENLQTSIEEYTAWFILDKNIQEVSLDIDVEKVNISEKSEAKMEIIEVVNLVNQEKDGKVDYQVVLKWDNLIDISGDNYKIKERNLMESLVSYKDNNGNWVQY